MLVDLHMHSNCSDGALTPEEVVALAAKNGVELMSLTDHDTVIGIGRARAEAARRGIRFVSGVEISSRWGGKGIHVVGLNLKTEGPAIEDFFKDVVTKREKRGRIMGERFEDIGISGAYEGALSLAGNKDVLSRTHFALWLHQRGIVSTCQEAFDRYLKPGCPCSVDVDWPKVEESVAFILAQGGVPVLAHPGRYHFADEWMAVELLRHFKTAGGVAIEVCSGSQTRADDVRLAVLAREMDFLASTGSDWHSVRSKRPEPGTQPQLPAGLTPVWTLF